MNLEAAEQADLRHKKIRVGALFALAFVLALVFASWMGILGLGATRKIYVTYNFAGGIDRGSPVRLGGIRVGRVTEVKFDPASAEMIRLDVEVSKDAFSKITADSRFYVNLAGLIGERYLEVVPGEGALLAPGATVRGVDPPRVDQLISQGYGIFGDVRDFFNANKGDIKQIFDSLNQLAINLNKLLGGMTKDQKQQLDSILRNFSAMSGDMRTAVAHLAVAADRMDETGARESWAHMQSLLKKADRIQVNDLRRLMLEDGVKVNFSTKRVEADPSSSGGGTR